MVFRTELPPDSTGDSFALAGGRVGIRDSFQRLPITIDSRWNRPEPSLDLSLTPPALANPGVETILVPDCHRVKSWQAFAFSG